LPLWYEIHIVVQFMSWQDQFGINIYSLSGAAVKHKNLVESGGLFCSFDWLRGHVDLSQLICEVVGLIFALSLYQSIYFLWLVNLKILWGGRTDLHLKGVFISPFLSFWLVNLKLLTIPIDSFFLTDSEWFAAGDISPWKLQNLCKAVFRIPVYEGFS
jgi:hypothetical protein